MPDPLEIESLTHRYGDTAVFGGLDLRVAAGECVALLGESGCGKTTLLRDVAGLSSPSGGEIRISGRKVYGGGTDEPPKDRGVGLVFQDYALFPALTVAENIAFGLRPADPGRVRRLVGLAGLEGLESSLPSQLSGGQQQRTALARALAPGPGLLLLDEPFANIDAGMRRQLAESLRGILKEEGASVLLVTHDRQDAFAMADRIAAMGKGPGGQNTVLQLAPPEELYRRPSAAEAARLSGEVLLLPGRAEGKAADTVAGRMELAEPRKGDVLLSIRPEQIEVVAAPEGPAEVQACWFAGERYILRLRLGQESFTAYSLAPAVKGSRVSVAADGPVWALP